MCFESYEEKIRSQIKCVQTQVDLFLFFFAREKKRKKTFPVIV